MSKFGTSVTPGHAMSSPFPRGLVIIAGNSHPKLAEDIARYARVIVHWQMWL